MKRSLKLLAVLAALALVLAACGGDDDSADTTAAPEATTGAPADTTAAPAASTTAAPESSTTAGGEAGASVDGVLTYGTILPVTGSLAFLGPPEIAGARLAIEDINAAGGVLGADVVLVEGDSGDDTQDIVNPEVDRLLAQGADAIFGAASSAVTKLVIDKIVGANVIQFSPANTSPDFTTYDDNGLYFRTAPSDLLQGRVLADLIAGEGAQTLGILYRQEAYGEGLANAIRENFEGLGGTVDPFIAYDTSAETFDAEVDQLVQADPDAIVVVGFVESAVILTTMNERGIGPADKAVWGVDGNIGGIGAELQDPSIISGFRGTAPSVDLATITDFTDRLDAAYPPDGVGGIFDYAAETYDAMVITALAAVIAGTDDPVQVAAQINDVTRVGTKCTTFEECLPLAEGGEDIDYDGLGGPYEFEDAGEPSAASFRVSTYDGDALPNAELDEYVFAGG